MDRNLCIPGGCVVGSWVALRKESVDRNVFGFGAKLVHSVALRKESVDRNLIDEIQLEFNSRRSPQGERG